MCRSRCLLDLGAHPLFSLTRLEALKKKTGGLFTGAGVMASTSEPEIHTIPAVAKGMGKIPGVVCDRTTIGAIYTPEMETTRVAICQQMTSKNS